MVGKAGGGSGFEGGSGPSPFSRRGRAVTLSFPAGGPGRERDPPPWREREERNPGARGTEERTPAIRAAGRRRGADAASRRADAPAAAIPRIALVDWLRGAALIGMTVFHFAYDLEFFGFEEQGYADQPHWRYFATLVAGSFLFLAGVSLQLAHARGVRWSRWGRRLATIALAAVAIMVATPLRDPEHVDLLRHPPHDRVREHRGARVPALAVVVHGRGRGGGARDRPAR